MYKERTYEKMHKFVPTLVRNINNIHMITIMQCCLMFKYNATENMYSMQISFLVVRSSFYLLGEKIFITHLIYINALNMHRVFNRLTMHIITLSIKCNIKITTNMIHYTCILTNKCGRVVCNIYAPQEKKRKEQNRT